MSGYKRQWNIKSCCCGRACRGKFDLSILPGQLLLSSDKKDILIPTTSITGVVVSWPSMDLKNPSLSCRGIWEEQPAVSV